MTADQVGRSGVFKKSMQMNGSRIFPINDSLIRLKVDWQASTVLRHFGMWLPY